MSLDNYSTLIIGVFLAETVKNIAKGAANTLYNNSNLLFNSEITTLGLNDSIDAEEVTKRLEARPEVLETIRQKLNANPQLAEEMIKTINARDIFTSNISSHYQSGGQTANNITNIHNYNPASSNTKTENQEVEKPDVKVFFENNKMYVESHYRPNLTKIIQMKVENNGDKKFTDLQAFVDLEGYQKPFRRIPLTLPFKSYQLTEFGLTRGGEQFFYVLEWSSDYPNRINFKSPPEFHPQNIITLEANQEVTMVIMILGSINPCIKRFTLYHNNKDLFIEEVDDNNAT